MDPDANLAELCELARIIIEADEDEVDAADARRLAELVEALDGWITGGGFLPARWRAGAVR